MKKLIMFLLVHINPNAIFCQDKIDTVHIGRLKLIFRSDTLYNQFVTGRAVDARDTPTKPDTLRSVLLVTGKPPSFTHAVYGYCVRRNGICVGHLDSRQRLFKLPVRVWGCDNNNNLKQGKDERRL